MKLLEFCSLFCLLIFPGMVDPSLAEWRICLLDWVPMCRSLFPRVWYLDAVCFCWLHTSSRAWCLRQQSSYWSKFCLCSWLSPFFSCQLCVSFFPIKKREDFAVIPDAKENLRLPLHFVDFPLLELISQKWVLRVWWWLLLEFFCSTDLKGKVVIKTHHYLCFVLVSDQRG